MLLSGLGSVAAVSSIGSAIELLSNDEWKKKYLMIEGDVECSLIYFSRLRRELTIDCTSSTLS